MLAFDDLVHSLSEQDKTGGAVDAGLGWDDDGMTLMEVELSCLDEMGWDGCVFSSLSLLSLLPLPAGRAD
jgi:hypothetical protein